MRDQPPGNADAGGEKSRRRFVQSLAHVAGAALLLRAGSGIFVPPARAQNEEDHSGHDSESGRGRGRGRGRGGREEAGDQSAEEDVVQVQTAAVPEGSLEVRIVSDDAGGFVPAELTVDQGQSVSFVNAHDDEHTATGSGFDTGIIPPGGVITITLDTPGRFAYACQIHPEMTGAIAVRDSNGSIPEASPEAAPAGATAVTIANLAFDPAQLEIATGTTVVWENRDSVPHTATALDGTFDSGIFDPGASFSWTFDTPGTFAYACLLHPAMQGSVTVSGQTSSTPAENSLTPAETASQETSSLAGVWSLDLLPSATTLFGQQRALLTLRADGTLSADFATTSSSADPTPYFDVGQGQWVQRESLLSFAIATLLKAEANRFVAQVTLIGEVRFDAPGSSIDGTFDFSAASATGEAIDDGSGTLSGSKLTLPL